MNKTEETDELLELDFEMTEEMYWLEYRLLYLMELKTEADKNKLTVSKAAKIIEKYGAIADPVNIVGIYVDLYGKDVLDAIDD